MKRIFALSVVIAVSVISFIIFGCGVNEAKVKELAHQEALKAIQEYKQSFTLDRYRFGIPWEEEWSYAQGVKAGNMIFVAGQLAHGREVIADDLPEFYMGDFNEQFRASLENVKAVLANYGATMDNVVFLQNFIDADANGKKAGNYWDVAQKVIQEYFPKGFHAMIFVEVENLWGEEELVEVNAIAVVDK